MTIISDWLRLSSPSRVLARSAGTICLLLLFTISCLVAATVSGGLTNPLGMILVGLYGVGVAYFAVLMVVRAIQMQWMAAAGAAACVLVSVAPVAGFFALMIAAFSSEDGFADDLVIPEGVAATAPHDPGAWYMSRTPTDRFQTAIFEALENPGNDDLSFIPDLTHLIAVHAHKPELLERYLAADPGWRVFRERGKRYAVRRWAIGSRWRFLQHGTAAYDAPDLHGPLPRHFWSGMGIGLSGSPWFRDSGNSTIARSGERVAPRFSGGDHDSSARLRTSLCVISSGDLVVEVYEGSDNAERRITKAAIEFVNEEMRALRGVRDWPALKAILDASAVRSGEPDFELYNGGQPGIYDSEIWVNPGEPGMIYLKAFEITREYRLSADRLVEESNEWVGWSDDPRELFFSNTHFMIGEGDWGKPYAVRFEVWFVPDSGGPERKLLEKIFKVEGWMR